MDDLAQWLQQHGELNQNVDQFIVKFGVPDGI